MDSAQDSSSKAKEPTFADDPGWDAYDRRWVKGQGLKYAHLRRKMIAQVVKRLGHWWEMRKDLPECAPGCYFRECTKCHVLYPREEALLKRNLERCLGSFDGAIEKHE